MQARNYVIKYKSQSKTGYSNYYKIQATEKWVEYQLDVYDMSNMLMSVNDFNTKIDLLEAIAVAERKRDYMYRHPNFNLSRASRLFQLVKDSPKALA
jgi:hypothetical protein